MTKEELNRILENHLHWLKEDVDGWKNMRANLRYADLRYANLRYADLRYANLRYADLRYANLRYANLSNADLSNADLSDANLSNADLRYADLRYANLSNANLSNADLRCAKNLSDAKNVPFIPINCPETGSFIGYKKALNSEYDSCIVKLQILEDSKRLSSTGRKCRCDKAKVISIESLDGNDSYDKAISAYDHGFIYRVGEIVYADNFNEYRFNECSGGIHFFINRQEAVDYQ